MSFDKELRNALEDIEIPEELLPHNIEAMLKKAGKQEINTASQPESSKVITVSRSSANRAVIMRTLAAAAACIALAAGFTAFRKESAKPVEIESEIDYEAVQVQSYDELYNIYTGIYLNNSGETANGAENGDGVEIITDENAVTEVTEITEVTETTPVVVPAVTEAAPAQTDIPQEIIEPARQDFSDADIVKSDDRSIYYICGGTLYAVSKEDMEMTAKIETENPPFEMYINGSSLVLVSSEKVSDSQDCVCVDIYDISADAPAHIRSYKQSGVYTSVRIDDSGILYLVTGYADYREAPLDQNADLATYVPSYYVDGEKRFVAAEDIIVPPSASNTNYTVVSAIKCSEPTDISVKAVLGSSADAYCSDDSLYVASTGIKDGKEYTSVTKLSLSGSTLVYTASGSVEGELISRYSMCEDGGKFRIACRTYSVNGMVTTSIYTLSEHLNLISSAEGLLPGTITGSVKFDGSYAYIYESGGSEPVQVVDLDQSAPIGENAGSGYMASYVNSFSDTLMVGISSPESGGLCLELYSSETGAKISDISFAQLPQVTSPALTDRKAMLINYDSNVIGIPVSSVNEFGVKNLYYVFGCDENGFTERGVIEYNDLDDSYRFDRAVVTDGNLYIIGNGRMVSVRLLDMTVIDSFDF